MPDVELPIVEVPAVVSGSGVTGMKIGRLPEAIAALCKREISIAKLLWRNEAIEILQKSEISNKILRQPRTVLYEYLVNILSICELRKAVRDYFKKRKNWRCPELLSRYDDLCQSAATS